MTDITLEKLNELNNLGLNTLVYNSEQAKTYFDQGIELCKLVYNKNIQLYKDIFCQLYTNRSIAEYNLQDYVHSRYDLEEAISMEPTYYMPYLYKGYIYCNSEEFFLAKKCYDMAYNLDPKYIKTLDSDRLELIAHTYFRNKEFDKTLIFLKELSERDPNTNKIYEYIWVTKQCINKNHPDIMLINAIRKNSCKKVKEWIMKGADINSRDAKGIAAIDYAIRNKNSKIIKLLEENGALVPYISQTTQDHKINQIKNLQEDKVSLLNSCE